MRSPHCAKGKVALEVSTVSIVCNPYWAPAGVGASRSTSVVATGDMPAPQCCRSESAPDALSQTLLTLLTVFSGNERIRITLLPARPWRLPFFAGSV